MLSDQEYSFFHSGYKQIILAFVQTLDASHDTDQIVQTTIE